MDLDKIIQKAEQEKDKKLKREADRIAKEALAKESAFRRWWNSLLPYRLFRKFNYRGTAWLFVLSLALAFTCYMIPFDDFGEDSIFPTLLTITSVVLGLIFLTLFLGVELYTFLRYPTFKNFPSTLGFELQGWEEALRQKEFLDFENWWIECSLLIELNATEKADPKALEALQALCFLNSKKCNREFYTPFLSETRTPWTSHDLKMKGSANNYVIGVLYEFIRRELNPFHTQTQLLRKVTLTGDKKITYVSRETSD